MCDRAKSPREEEQLKGREEQYGYVRLFSSLRVGVSVSVGRMGHTVETIQEDQFQHMFDCAYKLPFDLQT